ncbi:MAG: preprotein translocase subunit SecG [Nitrospirota bacterium]
MITFLTVIHVFVCLAVVLIVLLQQGKGADIGATFGTGGSQTVFGGRGAGNFLTKLTAAAGAIFMITSLALAIIESHGSSSSIVRVPSGPTAPPAATRPAIPQKGAPFVPATPSGAPSMPAAPVQKGGK